MLRATWYKGTAQLLSLTELKLHSFELYFIGWTIKLMKYGRKPEYPEKTPDNKLQKMPHTTAWRFKPQARLEPTQQHWWQARKADMLTVTPCVAMHHPGQQAQHTTNWSISSQPAILVARSKMLIIIIIIIIMSVLLERLSMWNMHNCAEQVQIQKYKNTCIQDTQNSQCPNNHAETSNKV